MDVKGGGVGRGSGRYVRLKEGTGFFCCMSMLARLFVRMKGWMMLVLVMNESVSFDGWLAGSFVCWRELGMSEDAKTMDGFGTQLGSRGVVFASERE